MSEAEPESKSNPEARILIIDDEAAIRESLETLLSLEGYAVDTAADGVQGLARIDARPYDLVLLDFALPGQNGLEVLGRIRERQPNLPVIMITAYDTGRHAMDAMRAGAQNFVAKPWDNEKSWPTSALPSLGAKRKKKTFSLKRALKQRYNFENIIGKSEPMLRISTWLPRWLLLAPRFLSRARAEPAKSCSPKRSMPILPAATSRSCR